MKKIITISAFIILPFLLVSLGNAESSLTRVYISSGSFTFSIFFGALITTNFYAQNIKNRTLRYTLIGLFGVVIPILYIISAFEVYGSGFKEYSETWSPVFFFTTWIGVIEIILYIGIFFILFISMIRSPIQAISSLILKQKKMTLKVMYQR